MKRVGELFNVNTFIVSQVNPYVIPFIPMMEGGGVLESHFKRKLIYTIKMLIANELYHVLS